MHLTVTVNEDIVRNRANVVASWAGWDKIVPNVTRILDVKMAPAVVHGNVIVTKDGVECSAMKVKQKVASWEFF